LSNDRSYIMENPPLGRKSRGFYASRNGISLKRRFLDFTRTGDLPLLTTHFCSLQPLTYDFITSVSDLPPIIFVPFKHWRICFQKSGGNLHWILTEHAVNDTL